MTAQSEVEPLETLLAEIGACSACSEVLPLGPRPVLQISPTARILVASQAPGTKVHLSGVPFSDASGDRLREWMGVSDDQFYDASRIAIVPMGLCYPGRGASGDAPPRPECAPLWRARVMAQLQELRLTLLVGSHAQIDRLGRGAMTERVRNFRDHLPAVFPLPHPSWRSQVWMKRNPWFEAEVLPALRDAVRGGAGVTGEALLPIYTVGHSTRTIEQFVELLRCGQVDMLVDIRSTPRSRTNPQYNLDTLPGALAERQIGHIRIDELGGRRPKSKTVPPQVNAFWTNQSFHNYADYALSDEFHAGLKQLQELARVRRCAVMCSEAVWWRCHRRFVADYLLSEGRKVFHLMGADRVEPAKINSAARKVADGLVYPALEPE